MVLELSAVAMLVLKSRKKTRHDGISIGRRMVQATALDGGSCGGRHKPPQS